MWGLPLLVNRQDRGHTVSGRGFCFFSKMTAALNVVMPTSWTHAFIFFISREPSLWLSIAFPTKKDHLSNGSVPLMTVSVCFLLIIIRRLCRVCSYPGQRMSVFPGFQHCDVDRHSHWTLSAQFLLSIDERFACNVQKSIRKLNNNLFSPLWIQLVCLK